MRWLHPPVAGYLAVALMLSAAISAAPPSRQAAGGTAEPARPVRQALTEKGFRAVPNLIQNPSFEMDWMHNRVTAQTRFQLLEQSDWGYGQSDGLPDCWVVSLPSRLDATIAHFGKASLLLQGSASQVVYLCGETDPRDGGAHYNAFRPLPAGLTDGLKSRPLIFGVWCKTANADAPPTLTVTVEYASGEQVTPRTQTVSFGKGTHDWEYRQVTFPALPGGGLAHAALVRLDYRGAGSAWFDGVLGEEETAPAEVNLLPNSGFEEMHEGWPSGWSRPELWSWSRRSYYRFTGWSHRRGTMNGGAAVVRAGREGGQGLQLTVLPGDNLAVRSQPIKLRQEKPRVLEVAAWVRADNLRWLEIMAQDEKGEWLPQQDFAGFMGTDEHYRNRPIGLGSHDWEYVRKHLAPRRPVQELTLWLCARGFDGQLMQRNLVGTVWFDDVSLCERGSTRAELVRRGVTIPPPSRPASVEEGYDIVSLDPGERLWGRNELRLRLRNPTGKSLRVDPEPMLRTAGGKSLLVRAAVLEIPAHGEKELVVPYRVQDLCADWHEQYRWEQPLSLPFGTPPSPVSVRLGGCYVYPDEKLEAGINLNVSRGSLAEITRCRIVVRHPGGEKTLLETQDLARSLWTPEQKRPALLDAGHVDARHLLALSIDGKGLPRHPFSNPVRDCRLAVTLEGKDGRPLLSAMSEPFGFLERPVAPSLPEVIRRTEVTEGGVIHVNGQPFTFDCFPRAATDLGAISRMLNFPKSHKILALPFPAELTFAPAQDEVWKRKVQDFVRANRKDPKLFGYCFAHNGETSFWLKQWREMAACQRKVAGWVREVDTDHIILSAEWLFGHGALTPEAAKPFDFLDVLDVEPGLKWTPDCHAVRRAAGRPLAVVAGLECYYFQQIPMVRWRMYEALRQGATGMGICPSNMLHPTPETVSFLRGLSGELAGLQPLLTGRVPREPIKCDSPDVTLWEKQNGSMRYLVAMRGDGQADEKLRAVTFTLPRPAKRIEVLFEGRTTSATDGKFTDRFDESFTVRVYRVQE